MRFSHIRNAAAMAMFSMSVFSTHAAAIHDAELFTNFKLKASDDRSSGPVDIGFSVAIGSTNFSQLYVNNNGNVSFGQELLEYTPKGFVSGSNVLIAPYWADVDTRGRGSNITTYGTGVIGGHKVFGVNWIDVGYFERETDKLNSFQLILIDRSDIGTGNVDIQFNYDKVQWETGDGSNGTSGLGGNSAAVGFATSTNNKFQLPGSFVNGAFLDGGPNALVSHSIASDVSGQYNFALRDGEVISPVPEPETYAMLSGGLGMLGFMARRRRKSAGKPASR